MKTSNTIATLLIATASLTATNASAMVFDNQPENINYVSALSCNWSQSAINKYESLKAEGTPEAHYFARFVEAEILVCKGSSLSTNQIMRLHSNNDVAAR